VKQLESHRDKVQRYIHNQNKILEFAEKERSNSKQRQHLKISMFQPSVLSSLSPQKQGSAESEGSPNPYSNNF